jgi:hypothetical protein
MNGGLETKEKMLKIVYPNQKTELWPLAVTIKLDKRKRWNISGTYRDNGADKIGRIIAGRT